MPNDHSLISTIAVGLGFAFVGGLVAHRLKLPPLVGYLLAGIAVGPFTPGFVADVKLAPQLAEIGVILLMFGVGLHFSVKDLLAVRRLVVPGALLQILAATLMGLAASWFWDWSLGGGLILGLALSVASTVVLLRMLEEAGLLTSEDGRIAVGWLVVEDLIMVLALVLLPTLAGPLGAANAPAPPAGGIWVSIGLTILKITAFVAMMLLGGSKFFPWLLARVLGTASRELFTLAVIALSLGVAYVSAELFGVSYALGAFFAGVVLHESTLSNRAADDLRPLQDTFAALFFVSVGMLFDPAVLLQKPLRVAVVVGIILLGKSIAAFAIIRFLGKSRRTAWTVSVALAQIGEFSFILAGVGMQLGLLPQEGQSLLVAGALISITINPFLFQMVRRMKKEEERVSPVEKLV